MLSKVPRTAGDLESECSAGVPACIQKGNPLLWKNLLFISVKDLVARKGRLLLTMMGITVGVTCLLFLLSLTTAIKKKVLTEVLGTIPETELDVMPLEVEWGAIRFQKADTPTLDDEEIDRIKKSIPGIKKLYGIESLDIPAEIEGTIKVEVPLLKKDVPIKGFATDCGVSGIPRELFLDGLERPEEYVFMGEKGPVPIVLSTHLVEMYNMHFAKAMGMPKVSGTWIKQQEFDLTIGESGVIETRGARMVMGPFKCKVVGVSRRAPIWSISVPPPYVGYWRKLYYGEEKERTYQKVVIYAESVNLVENMEAKLRKMGFEVVTNRETISKINTASTIINALVVVLGLIILLISAASIINILTMSVYEEATDIAILRAVGARKSHVRGIYLLKAGFIGLLGALDGLVIGLIAIGITNNLAEKYLQNLPYRPDTFFLPSVSLAVGCFLVGLVFSLVAGVIPANIAASLNPSKVLREG
jgi:ABC-type lipoprotein release transport system permease subunit